MQGKSAYVGNRIMGSRSRSVTLKRVTIRSTSPIRPRTVQMIGREWRLRVSKLGRALSRSNQTFTGPSLFEYAGISGLKRKPASL